jgi:heterodisulfide reductase subunit A
MAVANAAAGEPLQELEFEVDSRLLVVGGGLAGMTAAIEAAKQGFGVYLIEREPILGGHLRNLNRNSDGRKFASFIEDLGEQVLQDERIKVFTSSEVVEQNGFVGAFETDIVMPSGATRTLKHGAILIATGAQEYRPEIHGLGTLERVMTQTDFEAALEKGDLQGRENLRVAMLQCAGSRDSEGLSYCSRVCCNHAVKNSLTLKKKFPDSRVDVLYRDMRCYGHGEIDYRNARRAGVNFIRFDPVENPPSITAEESGIAIRVTDPSIDMEVNIYPDILVLSNGMQPRDTDDLASM